MPDAVFIETTIPSYYVARPSRNIIQLARQELTRRWWDLHRSRYELFTSDIVLEEAADGESAMAQERLTLLTSLPLLDISEQVDDLANELVQNGILPPVTLRDAFHIAASTVHRMQFLLTWNCRHIANPHIRQRLRTCFSRSGIDFPVICTPEELLADDNDNAESE